jgi:hypothetical protein
MIRLACHSLPPAGRAGDSSVVTETMIMAGGWPVRADGSSNPAPRLQW